MSTYKDRVRETTTTTGVGDITLAGAVTGFVTFNAAIGLNLPFDYFVEGIDGNGVATGEWEVGVGYLSGSSTLVRLRPLDGSAALPVNLSAGTKRVVCTIAANQVIGKGRLHARYTGLALP